MTRLMSPVEAVGTEEIALTENEFKSVIDFFAILAKVRNARSRLGLNSLNTHLDTIEPE